MRRSLATVLALGAGVASSPRALAQPELPVFNERQPPPANVPVELIDPNTFSRFDLITRTSFSDGNKVFSSASLWSFEGRADFQLVDGLALAFTLPFGYSSPDRGPNEFFFGNLSAGITGGGRIRLREAHGESVPPMLGLAGGLDVYAPTAPRSDPPDQQSVAELNVALMRAYEPFLYLPNVMSFRGRLHADLLVSIFTAELELGLIPGFTITGNSDFLMWFSVGGRVSARVSNEVDLFLEGGTAIQVSGPYPVGGSHTRDFSPPFLLTPGARFHIFDLDPAVFVSFNLKNSAAIIFGIDLGGVVQHTRSETMDQNPDDFLKGI